MPGASSTCHPYLSLLLSSPSRSYLGPVPHDASYYAKCMLGGAVACGFTHAGITPLDVTKCNMQVSLIPALTHPPVVLRPRSSPRILRRAILSRFQIRNGGVAPSILRGWMSAGIRSHERLWRPTSDTSSSFRQTRTLPLGGGSSICKVFAVILIAIIPLGRPRQVQGPWFRSPYHRRRGGYQGSLEGLRPHLRRLLPPGSLQVRSLRVLQGPVHEPRW